MNNHRIDSGIFHTLKSGSHRSLFYALLALSLWAAAPTTGSSADASQPAPLPKGTWTEPTEGYAVDAFTLGTGETHVGGWGAYSPNERRFFNEFLPALFERTLVVNGPTSQRGFRWILTGERASLTIEHDGPTKTLNLSIRFYDSSAFDILDRQVVSNQPARKHPEREVQQASFILPDSDAPRALTVRLDHKLTLTVLADGAPVLKTSAWAHTFSRHQLQLFKGKTPLDFRLFTPQARSVNVTVDSAKTHQTMLGWGGIGTPTAYRELSEEGRRQWWRWVADYNLLFQREYPIGAELNPEMDNWENIRDAKAHYYGDNFPNGEVSDFAYNRAMQDLGGFVIFEFWDFPRWIGRNADAYAKAMVRYCELAKAKTGSAPFAVGMQNEVHMEEKVVEPFAKALRKGLDEHGFKDVKIHMTNASNFRLGFIQLPFYRDNPAVWDKLDFAAVNPYEIADFYGDMDRIDEKLQNWRALIGDKPYLATEYCSLNRKLQNDGYLVALSNAQGYHKLLTLADASLISYCWTILNVEQPSYAMTRTLFGIDRTNGFVPKPYSAQLRIYGSYSRRVQRGMVRTDAVSTDADLMVTAFKGKDGRNTLVLLNRGTSPAAVNCTWPDAKPTTAELTDPYHQNQVLSGAPDISRPVIVPGGAIITLSDVPLVSVPANFQTP
jgi:hypothetical protein